MASSRNSSSSSGSDIWTSPFNAAAAEYLSPRKIEENKQIERRNASNASKLFYF